LSLTVIFNYLCNNKSKNPSPGDKFTYIVAWITLLVSGFLLGTAVYRQELISAVFRNVRQGFSNVRAGGFQGLSI
jgi:hypothetical protein